MGDGNTLITSGPDGRVFEVNGRRELVWEYWNPYSGDAPNPAGDPAYSLFRATFVPRDYPGVRGREIKAMDPQPAGVRRGL